MAGLEDLLEADITKGVAIGLGVVAAGVMLAPALRPVTRAAVKRGILLFEKGREWVAEASEQFEDLVAEVRAEMAEAHLATAGLADTVEAAAVEPVERCLSI